MAISVVTLNDHAGGAGDSRATELRDMVSASGGVLCGDAKAEALVCDVRGIRSTENLTLLQSALQGPISKMPRNGRIVMIANDTSLLLGREQAVAAASAAAVQGFVKSMAKEVAGKGITANTLMASEDLDSRQGLSGPLLYFLSKRSSFVTGQTLKLSNNNQFRASENPGESFSVRGKRVVLTGASRGIGAYTAKLFSAEGADLLLVDHPSMEKTLSGFAATLGCKSVSLDVADAGSPAALKSSILKAFGDHHMDVVVHNAGITRDKSYKKMSAEGFKDVIDVNLSSIIRMDDMLFSDCFKAGSRAVYLSSISGIAGTFGQTNYGCSKAGVVGYVASLGASVQSHGIGVNAVAPGFIETEMTGKIPLLTRNVGRHMNALLQGGFPVDVAEAILFLSTPAAAGVNGNTLRVCGNHLLGA
ncbi:unnamed protein product [Ectocarpus fasciculatus]